MKKSLLIATIAMAALFYARAETVALWDFNSPEPDTDATTGTLLPKIGTGACLPIGPTISYRFQGSTSSDPWIFDNSCLRISSFPIATSANKTSGVQYMFSTAGYENISVSWEHNNNTSASKYWRVQYTADGGTTWNDYEVLISIAGVWFFFNVDFAGLAAADNNPNFGFRLVSEFESTATGMGDNHSYVGISVTYATAGTLWNDLFTVNGDPVNPGNLRPTISAIPDQILRVGQSSVMIPFTVGDNETSANDLMVWAETSQGEVVQSVDIGGAGANRTATINATGTLGTSMVKIRVTDGGGKYTERRFNVSMLPANTAPTLSVIPKQATLETTPLVIPFTVNDLETSPDALTLTVSASDPGFIPSPANAVISGSGTSKTLTLTPGKAGVADIIITADDGQLTADTKFLLRVTRPEMPAFWDFNSPEPDADGATGTLLSTTGNGECEIVGQSTYRFQASANSDPAADQSALRVAGFPAVDQANKTSGVQYKFSTAGHRNVSVIWEHNNNAGASRYWRMQYTADGSTWTDYQVFTNTLAGAWFFYSIDFKGLAAADNNPNFGFRFLSEFESTATGSGAESYVGVSGDYTTGGTLWMDMVTVTADVVGQQPVALGIEAKAGGIEVSWPASAAGTLESTSTLAAPNWQSVTAQPLVSGERKVVTITPAGTAQFFRLRQ
jgi:hypothetical protein